MRKMLVVVVMLGGGAAALTAFTADERRRVALDASGEWWCKGEACTTNSCRVDAECYPQKNAACASARLIIRDEVIRLCSPAISYCLETRERMLKDPDVDDVSGCRVVSAAAEDRESYGRHVVCKWIVDGLLVGVGAIVVASRTARRRRLPGGRV